MSQYWKKEDSEECGKIDVDGFTLFQRRQEIINFIINNPVGILVVEVPTGGGKTLGLPHIIKEDVISQLGETRSVILEANRAVVEDVRESLEGILAERVGMRIGRDKGLNYHGERFTIGTVGASHGLVKKEQWNIVILDEFDLDQNGDVAIMQNCLWHMLLAAKEKGDRLTVILPSATPDLVNAEKFYKSDYPFMVIKVDDRIYNPEVLWVDIGSSNALNFSDILEQYTEKIVQIVTTGIDGHRVPVGKNVLCTVPSPVYFEKLQIKIMDEIRDNNLNPSDFEVVTLWSKSSKGDKKLLFSGGDQSKTTIFLATDLIRRGGTPDIYAVFPSGWQVRDYYNPDTGIEGTREERASKADYKQDEGRASRKEKGLVVHIEDSKRPEVGLTFLERKPLELFLLNVIHYEDLRTFKWWGDVSEEKIATAVANLRKVGAVEEDEEGKITLTSLGRAIRGIPGSLQMRVMTLNAQREGILKHFILVSAGIACYDNLFIVPRGDKEKEMELKGKQAPLKNSQSDYLTVLRVWSLIAEKFKLKIDGILARVEKDIQRRKNIARATLDRKISGITRNPKLGAKQKGVAIKRANEKLDEEFQFIKLSRKDAEEEAILGMAQKILGSVAFENGLFKKGLEIFLKNVIQTVRFLNGKTFKMNGCPEQKISLDIVDILKTTIDKEQEAQIADPIHRILLSGLSDFIWKNKSFRGGIGYYYSNFSENIGIFPGSSCFNGRREWAIGTPVDRKGRKFLQNVAMFTSEEFGRLLKATGHPLMKLEEGIEAEYDSEKDQVWSKTRVILGDEELFEEEVENQTHPQAHEIFINWLADQMTI